MKLMTTDSAMNQMRQYIGNDTDRLDMVNLLARLAHAERATGTDSPEFQGLFRPTRRIGDSDIFLARSGKIRALLIVDPSVPEQMTVVKVYRADEDEGTALENAIRDVGELTS
jgi:hypothetical protein